MGARKNRRCSRWWRRCFDLAAPLASEDASDALAIAICHATQAAVSGAGGSRLRYLLPLLAAAAFLRFAAAGPEASPRLTFSKSFPGSLPPWEEITVDKSGAGQYKEDPKDEDPLKFQLTEAQASRDVQSGR